MANAKDSIRIKIISWVFKLVVRFVKVAAPLHQLVADLTRKKNCCGSVALYDAWTAQREVFRTSNP